jgi:hypothetical protein
MKMKSVKRTRWFYWCKRKEGHSKLLYQEEIVYFQYLLLTNNWCSFDSQIKILQI